MGKRSNHLVVFLLATSILLGATAIWGWVQFGSLKAALMYTGGKRVFADSEVSTVGDLLPNTRTSAKFQLANFTDKAITVYGSTASCSCLVVDELPKTIPAGGREAIEIAYRASAVSGEIRQLVVLFTDDAISPRISLAITGRIVDEAGHGRDLNK